MLLGLHWPLIFAKFVNVLLMEFEHLPGAFGFPRDLCSLRATFGRQSEAEIYKVSCLHREKNNFISIRWCPSKIEALFPHFFTEREEFF